MPRSAKAAAYFGVLEALAAVVVIAFFGPVFERTTFGAASLSVIPLIAGVIAAAVASAILRSHKAQRMGPLFGAIVAMLTLAACTLYVSLPIGDGFLEFFPIMLLSALFRVGWIAIVLGAIAGWACRNYVLSEP